MREKKNIYFTMSAPEHDGKSTVTYQVLSIILVFTDDLHSMGITISSGVSMTT